MLEQLQGVGTEMALQMQHALAGERRQFGFLDPMQPPAAGASARCGRDERLRPMSLQRQVRRTDWAGRAGGKRNPWDIAA
jgi:hypothetical protein